MAFLLNLPKSARKTFLSFLNIYIQATEEESSDRHSSEEDGEGDASDDIWAISDVQARHYAGQFAQLRPDRGMLSGQTAR